LEKIFQNLLKKWEKRNFFDFTNNCYSCCPNGYSPFFPFRQKSSRRSPALALTRPRSTLLPATLYQAVLNFLLALFKRVPRNPRRKRYGQDDQAKGKKDSPTGEPHAPDQKRPGFFDDLEFEPEKTAHRSAEEPVIKEGPQEEPDKDV